MGIIQNAADSVTESAAFVLKREGWSDILYMIVVQIPDMSGDIGIAHLPVKPHIPSHLELV